MLFHEAVGHRLEGERQDNDTEGKTFKGQVGKRGAAALHHHRATTRRCATLGGKPLNGYYRYDDEGVKAQRVPLVEGGVLKNFLLSRHPVEGFLQSQRARAQPGRTGGRWRGWRT